MNTVEYILKLKSLVAQGKYPIVDFIPNRGKKFEHFTIVNMPGNIPISIFGWANGNETAKMEFRIEDITIESKYTLAKLPAHINIGGSYKLFDTLTADLD